MMPHQLWGPSFLADTSNRVRTNGWVRLMACATAFLITNLACSEVMSERSSGLVEIRTL